MSDEPTQRFDAPQPASGSPAPGIQPASQMGYQAPQQPSSDQTLGGYPNQTAGVEQPPVPAGPGEAAGIGTRAAISPLEGPAKDRIALGAGVVGLLLLLISLAVDWMTISATIAGIGEVSDSGGLTDFDNDHFFVILLYYLSAAALITTTIAIRIVPFALRNLVWAVGMIFSALTILSVILVFWVVRSDAQDQAESMAGLMVGEAVVPDISVNPSVGWFMALVGTIALETALFLSRPIRTVAASGPATREGGIPPYGQKH